MVDYDEGDVTTLELQNVPPAKTPFTGASSKTSTGGMEVKCEGGVCYPKFKNKSKV